MVPPSQSKRVFASGSPEETFALGMQLGRHVEAGDFIGLLGELGSGKTLLVRGLVEGIGVPPGQVASPSFAIVYPYQGRLALYHADFYRLSGYDELYATGFTDLLGTDSVIAVEWLNRIPAVAPKELLEIELQFVGTEEKNVRQIIARAFGERYCRLLDAWIGLPVSTSAR